MRLEKIVSEALKYANDNRYLLSVGVAKRVSQLQSGADPLVEVAKFEKPVDIALREIAAGLIEIKSS
ncbi:MAG: DNA-directed RNA polymerase subunit omega [Helicobacteraceae bacterium]|jgi:DNA-directed RNA polymerase omega subunit|nr:DNA-directed RNA polymerase subunit omega [Helicobacteraceae bacterium]